MSALLEIPVSDSSQVLTAGALVLIPGGAVAREVVVEYDDEEDEVGSVHYGSEPMLKVVPDVPEEIQELTATELKWRLDAGADLQLIDVREPEEFAIAHLPGAKLIPLGQLAEHAHEIDSTREAVLICKLGGRGERAISELKATGFPGKLINLVGGIQAWSDEVDPSLPRY
jgi:rhodanese-related sulfurtransferase